MEKETKELRISLTKSEYERAKELKDYLGLEWRELLLLLVELYKTNKMGGGKGDKQ